MPQIREEVVIFLAALLTGMIVRLVYIGLNVFRQIVRHNLRIMESEDLIFWIGSAFYIFVQNYHTNNGSMRWYCILGVVGGAILISILYTQLKKVQKKIYTRKKNKCP